MKKTAFFFILLTFTGLGGCMLGPNFQKPTYNGPDKFRFDPSDSSKIVNLRWWELLDDPVLDTLIKTALRENRDVLSAAARVAAAQANIGYTKSLQWPDFNYNISVSGSGMSGNVSSGFKAYPEFSWEVGFWGKYRRMNEAARAELLATEYGKRMVQLSLISTVATTYFNILASYDLLQISKNTLASRDSALLIMMDKYEGGMIALMDYNQAKIQRDIAATVIPTYKRMIGLGENTMGILLGGYSKSIKMGKPFHEIDYELDIPTGIPSELLKRRPDVLQAEEMYRSLNAQIGIAEAMRWPSLNLTGLLGAASTDLTTLNAVGLSWSAGSMLLGPIFQFGRNKRRVEMARENAKVALMGYEKTVQQAFREVEDALINIATYREESIAQASRTKTAISSEELSYIRYNEGSTTYLEVLEQQRQSFSSQLELLTARLNLLNSYIFLYKALGGGWLSPEEEKAYLNQNKP